MREILFRGKRTDNGNWVQGVPWEALNGSGWYLFQVAEIAGAERMIHVKVDPATIGQYTGLDTNGKKIFEGDILEHHVQGGILVNRGVVNWDAKNARWAHQLNTMNPDFTFFKADAYEVVGNIHDNPELLKGEQP